MSWLNDVGDLLQQYKGTGAPPPSTSADFQKVSASAPASAMSSGVAEAFRSQNTPPFADMLSQLFGQSNAGQRAGILNQLIAAAGPAVLSGGLLSGLTGSSGGAAPTITAEQAQKIDPEAVRQLAQHAEQRDPSIIDRASEFYAQHPRLVQGLGATALAVIMSHMSKQQAH